VTILDQKPEHQSALKSDGTITAELRFAKGCSVFLLKSFCLYVQNKLTWPIVGRYYNLSIIDNINMSNVNIKYVNQVFKTLINI
jgi:hypothetical protein